MFDDPTLEGVASHPEERRGIDNGAGPVERLDAQHPLDRGKVEGFNEEGHAV